MEEIKAAVLKEWLEIDFYRTANKIGFSDSTKNVSEELVVQSIRCLDYETSVVEHLYFQMPRCIKSFGAL